MNTNNELLAMRDERVCQKQQSQDAMCDIWTFQDDALCGRQTGSSAISKSYELFLNTCTSAERVSGAPTSFRALTDCPFVLHPSRAH